MRLICGYQKKQSNIFGKNYRTYAAKCNQTGGKGISESSLERVYIFVGSTPGGIGYTKSNRFGSRTASRCGYPRNGTRDSVLLPRVADDET